MKEAVDAYGDLHDRGDRRQLMWLSKPLAVDDAIRMMRAAVPDSYNEFNANNVSRVLRQFRDSACVRFGREGSPVMYVEGTPAVRSRLERQKKTLKADEMSRCSAVRVEPERPEYASSERRQRHECDYSPGGAVVRFWFD